MNAQSKPPRSLFRFSLRTLLILVTLLAVWLGWQMYRRREQAQVMAAVTERGGTASLMLPDLSLLSRIKAPWTQENDAWLQNLNVTDDELKQFEAVPELLGLHVGDNQITDRGLAHLQNRTDLRVLDLTNNPAITDAGLAHLKNLTQLRQLLLRKNSQITDAGLAHLAQMQHLDVLVLYGTQVTPAGVSQLKQKLPKARIGFAPGPAPKPPAAVPSPSGS